MFYIACVTETLVSYKSSNKNVHKTILTFDELWYYASLSSGHICLPIFSSAVGYVAISLQPNIHLIIQQNGSTVQISYRNEPRFEMSN